MMTADDLQRAFTAGLDHGARVRARRPGALFQVELPAYGSDGDSAPIYVKPGPGGSLIVTDLGSTRMRLGYSRRVTPEVDAELARLAGDQGLAFENGELRTEVSPRDLLAASLGLLQASAQAERLSVKAHRRSQEAETFREAVRELVAELFGKKVIGPYFDKKEDPEALYAIDAFVPGKRPLALAFVPGDLDAERAISSKMKLKASTPPATRWVAIPRDLEKLTSRTRKRLVKEYVAAGSSFEEDRAVVGERLKDLAA